MTKAQTYTTRQAAAILGISWRRLMHHTHHTEGVAPTGLATGRQGAHEWRRGDITAAAKTLGYSPDWDAA